MQLFLILTLTFGIFLTFALLLLLTESRKRLRPIVRDPEDSIIPETRASTFTAETTQKRQLTKSMATGTESKRTFRDSVPATAVNVAKALKSKSQALKSTIVADVSSTFRAPRRRKAAVNAGLIEPTLRPDVEKSFDKMREELLRDWTKQFEKQMREEFLGFLSKQFENQTAGLLKGPGERSGAPFTPSPEDMNNRLSTLGPRPVASRERRYESRLSFNPPPPYTPKVNRYESRISFNQPPQIRRTFELNNPDEAWYKSWDPRVEQARRPYFPRFSEATNPDGGPSQVEVRPSSREYVIMLALWRIVLPITFVLFVCYPAIKSTVKHLFIPAASTVTRLQDDPPVQFLDQPEGLSLSEQAAEDELARAYWTSAVRYIQPRYGFGSTLPVEPPPEFTTNLTIPKGKHLKDAAAIRELYWDKLRQIWSSPAVWKTSLIKHRSWLQRNLHSDVQ